MGPNTALMVLSSLSTEEIEHAILGGDVATIQKVKGIGAKTAQRIILELKDKIGKIDSGNSQIPSGFLNSNNKIRQEALQALITLGFPKASAEKNLDKVLKKTNGVETVEKQ